MSSLVLEALSQTARYTMDTGMLNNTNIMEAPAQPASSALPSTNDIRVNVLWFASLMSSLISASFAILVKQWLREYLGVMSSFDCHSKTFSSSL